MDAALNRARDRDARSHGRRLVHRRHGVQGGEAFSSREVGMRSMSVCPGAARRFSLVNAHRRQRGGRRDARSAEVKSPPGAVTPGGQPNAVRNRPFITRTAHDAFRRPHCRRRAYAWQDGGVWRAHVFHTTGRGYRWKYDRLCDCSTCWLPQSPSCNARLPREIQMVILRSSPIDECRISHRSKQDSISLSGGSSCPVVLPSRSLFFSAHGSPS